MKRRTTQEIEDFIANYQKSKNISTSWGVPLIRFAEAGDPLFGQLKTAVSQIYAVPCSHISPVQVKLKSKKN